MNWIGLFPVGMFVAGVLLLVWVWEQPAWTWKRWSAAIGGAIGVLTGAVWLLAFFAPGGPPPASGDPATLAGRKILKAQPLVGTGQKPGPTPPQPSYKLAPKKDLVVITKDGHGGGEIFFTVPGAPPVLHTGLTIKKGEAFLIHTEGYITNFTADLLCDDGIPPPERRVPAHEFANPHKPLHLILHSMPTGELVLITSAVPHGTHRVHARKDPGPVTPGRYVDGSPVRKIY